MENNKNSINIYADESSIDNPNNPMMIIGALFIRRHLVPEIKLKIKKIREKHKINGELKWIKTSYLILPFYKEIFEYLFSFDGDDVDFRCIVIDKSKVNYKKYHDQDKDLAFYKFYYQLLKNRIEEQGKYYIFLDFKPSKNKNSVRRLGEFLNFFYKNIKHIQAYPSDQNIFIQIADILTGAVGYSYNAKGESKNKKTLVEIIAKSIGRTNLNFCSNFWDKKFNIFCIDLTGRFK